MSAEQYLHAILEYLVKYPEDLKIVKTEDQIGTLLTVSCNREDMGVIIGKTGETARSIRNLVRIVGVRNGIRVSVKINEPDGSKFYQGNEGQLDNNNQ